MTACSQFGSNIAHAPVGGARRRGLTLVEVLLAMGLLTVGLLGVASIFPVGGRYAQLGDLADQGGAIAQASLEDAVVRGYLNPQNWIVHQIGGPGAVLPGSPTSAGFMRLATGVSERVQYVGLRDAMASGVFRVGQANRATRESYLATLFGGAIVIDPLGLAGAVSGAVHSDITSNTRSFPLRRFPATTGSITNRSPAWDPWMASGVFWPVRRATVAPVHSASDPPINLNKAAGFGYHLPPAQAAFTSADDPAIATPDSGDEPVRGRWETWANASGVYPSTRQARGDYSWLFTIAPGSSEALADWAAPPYVYPVEVSSVVFHKRAAPSDPQSALDSERLVRGQVVTAGPSGGEMRLVRRPEGEDMVTSSPFEELRAGQYVMVVGPHPSSTLRSPQLALRWCRVLRLEGDTSEDAVTVALRSGDWPWLSSGVPIESKDASAALSDDLRVAIVPGVVAVHTKTMQLESPSAWSFD